MLAHEDKKVKWKRVTAILGTTALSIYTIVTLQGPHGVGALRAKLAKIQELHEQQGNLSKAIEEKKKRVDSLEKGLDIEIEMRRFGRTLPGEVEYKVTEPKVDEPAEDATEGKKAN